MAQRTLALSHSRRRRATDRGKYKEASVPTAPFIPLYSLRQPLQKHLKVQGYHPLRTPGATLQRGSQSAFSLFEGIHKLIQSSSSPSPSVTTKLAPVHPPSSSPAVAHCHRFQSQTRRPDEKRRNERSSRRRPAGMVPRPRSAHGIAHRAAILAAACHFDPAPVRVTFLFLS
jgi:hypothetical protein